MKLLKTTSCKIYIFAFIETIHGANKKLVKPLY